MLAHSETNRSISGLLAFDERIITENHCFRRTPSVILAFPSRPRNCPFGQSLSAVTAPRAAFLGLPRPR
jgi:hypothetical protein